MRPTRIHPVCDLVRVKNFHTMEASTFLAPFNFCTVMNALVVSDMQRMVLGQIEYACHTIV
jgi:hypothetical protein